MGLKTLDPQSFFKAYFKLLKSSASLMLLKHRTGTRKSQVCRTKWGHLAIFGDFWHSQKSQRSVLTVGPKGPQDPEEAILLSGSRSDPQAL